MQYIQALGSKQMVYSVLKKFIKHAAYKPVSGISKWLLGRALSHLITSQGLFDPVYYRSRYTDLSEAAVDLLHHYVNYGIYENRCPSRDFSPERYYEVNPEMSSSDNAMIHYLLDTRRPRPIPPGGELRYLTLNDINIMSEAIFSSAVEGFIAEIAATKSNLELISQENQSLGGRIDRIAQEQRSFKDNIIDHYGNEIAKVAYLIREFHTELVALGNRFGVYESKIESRSKFNDELLKLERAITEFGKKQLFFEDQIEKLSNIVSPMRGAMDMFDVTLANKGAQLVELSDKTSAIFEIIQQKDQYLELQIENFVAKISLITESFENISSEFARERSKIFEHSDQISGIAGALNEHIQRTDRFINFQPKQIGEIIEGLRLDIRLVNERLNEQLNQSGLLLNSDEFMAMSNAINKCRTQLRLYVAPTVYGPMILKTNDLISDYVASGGVWDEHIIEVMSSISRSRKGTAVDIGGHFGTLTLPMSRYFKSVHVFEPNNFSFLLLKSNIALNNIINVNAYNVPLYSTSVEMALGDPDIQETEFPTNDIGILDPIRAPNLASFAFVPRANGTFVHTAFTLDHFDLTDVAFIKIDAQGADGEIIMGSLETIRKHKPVIIFEWEELLSKNFSVDLYSVFSKLEALGYFIHTLKKHNAKQIDYIAYPISARSPEFAGREG